MVVKGADLGDAIPCRECGGLNFPEAGKCWLCDRRDWRPVKVVAPSVETPSPKESLPEVFDPKTKPEGFPELPGPSASRRYPSTIMLIMISVAIGAVVLGTMRESPGLGILLLLASVPALIITLLKSRDQARSQGPMTFWAQVLMFFGLALGFFLTFATIAAVIVICIAVFLLIMCFQALGGSRPF